MNLKNLFSSKKGGFYVGAAVAAVALIADILFIAFDLQDKTFSFITFFMVLAGAAATVAELFLPFDFWPLVSTLFYGAGAGMHIYLALPTLSDVWNEVNFVGGNPVMAAVFSVIFLAVAIVSAVSCFMTRSAVKATAAPAEKA